MRTRLLNLWRQVRSSYWFVPSLMVASAIGLAFGLDPLDHLVTARADNLPDWLTLPGADNARVVLSTVAGSMITVAGVSFSVLVVAFSLAASQLGPRLLVTFMRDTGNQVVLGTFVSTFVYCLLVLRGIRSSGPGDEGWVPPVSTAFAVLLALASLGVLIYFFQHASTLIQAGHVVRTAGEQLVQEVERAFPADGGGEDEPLDEPPAPKPARLAAISDGSWRVLEAEGSGYLAPVAAAALLEVARRHDLEIEVTAMAGEFVAAGSPLARWSAAEAADDGPAGDGHVGSLRDLFLLSGQRGTAEDLQLAVDRLVEIALRAVSPGINDPFTALECIDRLAAGLALAASRPPPSRRHRDAEGRWRLTLTTPTVAGLVDSAFGPIRHYGGDDLSILLRLLEALTLIGIRGGGPGLAATLGRHLEAIRRRALGSLTEPWERERLEAWYAAAAEALGDAGAQDSL